MEEAGGKGREGAERGTAGGLLLSVLGALVGVQSRERLERDFASGRPWRYVAAGMVAMAVFVVVVVLVVRLVLRAAGA